MATTAADPMNTSTTAPPTLSPPPPPAGSASQLPLMEMLIVPASSCKAIFEALKDLLTDVNLCFDQDGMRIIAINSSNTVFAYLRLDADKLDKYACREAHVVGINIPQLYKNVRSASNGDALKFSSFVQNGDLLFRIQIESAARRTSHLIDMRTKDLDDPADDLIDQTYDVTITMPSADLQHAVKTIAMSAEDTIALTVCDDRLELSGTNNTVGQSGRLILRHDGDATALQAHNNGAAAAPVEGIHIASTLAAPMSVQFSSRHLQQFAKCAPTLSASVTINIDPVRPLFFGLNANNLGWLKLALAPKNDGDDDEQQAAEALAADGGDATGERYLPE